MMKKKKFLHKRKKMIPVQIHRRLLQFLQVKQTEKLLMDTLEFQLAVAIALGQYSEFPISVVEFPLISTDPKDSKTYTLVLNHMMQRTTQTIHLVARFCVRHGSETWEQSVTHPFILSHRKILGFYYKILHTYQVDTRLFLKNVASFLDRNLMALDTLRRYITPGDHGRFPIEKLLQKLMEEPLQLTESMETFLLMLKTFPLEKRTQRQKQHMYLSYWRQKNLAL